MVVPDGVTSLDVAAVGGHGGPGNFQVPGGFGAKVSGTLAATPGQVLYLQVGGNGQSGAAPNAGGGGGGGGASDVRTASASAGLTPTDPRRLVAGGGGGSGRGAGSGTAGYGGNGATVGGASRLSAPFAGGGGAGLPDGTGAGGTQPPTEGAAGQPGALGVGGYGALLGAAPTIPAARGYNGGGGGGGCSEMFVGNLFRVPRRRWRRWGYSAAARYRPSSRAAGAAAPTSSRRGGSAAASTEEAGRITLGFADATAPRDRARRGARPTRRSGVAWELRHRARRRDVTVFVHAGATATGAPVATGTAPCEGGSYQVVASGVGAGQYTARVRQVDSANDVGNSAARTYTIDLAGPALTVAAPSDAAVTADATPTVRGVAGVALG